LPGNKSIFQKLWSKRPAKIAGIIILTTVILAVFAYPLAPDSTPNANKMAVELSARPAGFKQEFLKIPKKRIPPAQPLLLRWFAGQQDNYIYIPINGYVCSANHIVIRHYIDNDLEDTLRYPLSVLGAPDSIPDMTKWVARHRISSQTYYLGTDRYGRDILSRLLVGSRVSLAVGVVSVILSLIIGMLLGALAGWHGGLIDDLIMWLINILWSIPTLLLVFAITLTIGKGFWEIFIAIGITSWVSAARLIRGQVMQLKEMDFITAARALGFRDARIIIRHILPNIAGPIMVIASANFASAILIEAGLSFLGIGVQPPTPSWGLMIKEQYTFLVAGNPVPALIPGLAIMILVLAFNILGNALRDVMDVQ
jgi:peptide/nickel transport system permease protein